VLQQVQLIFLTVVMCTRQKAI